MAKWYTDPTMESYEVKETATIREFYDKASQHPADYFPLFHSSILGTLCTRINTALGGSDTYSVVDKYIKDYFGSREFFPQYCCWYGVNGSEFARSHALITETMDALLAANKYKYEKYLAILELDYNPIWNVDSDETATEDRGARSETDVKGAVATTYSYGQDRQHFYKAPETTDNQYNKDGSKTTTLTRNGSETIERSNTQMNDLSFKLHDKEVRTPTNMTDTTVEPTYTNSSKTYRNDPNDKDDISTRDARSDTENKGAQTNTHKADKYTDKTHIIRQGNIGTKTTQSMIEEEKAVAKFYLLKEVAKDVVNTFTFGIYY